MMNVNEVDFLVVDDSRDVADSLSAVLQAFGHSTQVAYSAQEALEKAGALRPMCVMLDIGMPDIDGLQLARALRQKFGDNVILVAVTGYGEDHPRAAETFKIVDHYFTKPLSAEALRRMLPGR